MKTLAYLAGATALAATLASPAFAQMESSAGADAVGISDVSEQMKDVQDAVQDDFDRSGDAYRFGSPESRQGLFGSVALTYAGRKPSASVATGYHAQHEREQRALKPRGR